jgi:hypothetical protein
MTVINNPIRFVAIGSNVQADVQVQILYGNSFAVASPFYTATIDSDGIPIVIDLGWLSEIGLPGAFKLHSQVEDQHVHEGPFNYSLTGGLMFGAIKDIQGNFTDLTYIGP